MNFKEYIAEQSKTEVIGMFAETELALLGEAGEIIDEIKKNIFHQKKDRTDLIKELGDFFWYLVQFSKEVNAAPYLEQLALAMLTEEEMEGDEEFQNSVKSLRQDIDKTVTEIHYRPLLREFMKFVFNLTNFREGGNSLLGYKDGIPYPALKGLTDLQSEDLQNVVFYYGVFLKRYAKTSLSEILEKNIEKTHERYKNRLGE